MDFPPSTPFENFVGLVLFIQLLIAAFCLFGLVIFFAINCIPLIKGESINIKGESINKTNKMWLHVLYLSFYIIYPIATLIIAVILDEIHDDRIGTWLFVFGLLFYGYIIYRHAIELNNDQRKMKT